MTELNNNEHEKIAAQSTAGNTLAVAAESFDSSLPMFADNPAVKCSVAKMLWGHNEKASLNVRVSECGAIDFDDTIY